MVLDGLLDTQLAADELTLFHARYLVYGIAFGAWVGSRTEGVEDLEPEYDYQSARESGDPHSRVDQSKRRKTHPRAYCIR